VAMSLQFKLIFLVEMSSFFPFGLIMASRVLDASCFAQALFFVSMVTALLPVVLPLVVLPPPRPPHLPASPQPRYTLENHAGGEQAPTPPAEKKAQAERNALNTQTPRNQEHKEDLGQGLEEVWSSSAQKASLQTPREKWKKEG